MRSLQHIRQELNHAYSELEKDNFNSAIKSIGEAIEDILNEIEKI